MLEKSREIRASQDLQCDLFRRLGNGCLRGSKAQNPSASSDLHLRYVSTRRAGATSNPQSFECGVQSAEWGTPDYSRFGRRFCSTIVRVAAGTLATRRQRDYRAAQQRPPYLGIPMSCPEIQHATRPAMNIFCPKEVSKWHRPRSGQKQTLRVYWRKNCYYLSGKTLAENCWGRQNLTSSGLLLDSYPPTPGKCWQISLRLSKNGESSPSVASW